MELNGTAKEQVAAFWGQTPSEAVSFYSFPPVRDYLRECVSGQKAATGASSDSTDDWALKTFLAGRLPVDECLSICCGFGARDRDLARRGIFTHCTGIDISENAIREASISAKAEHHNIDYHVADLDKADLGVDKYDLVYAGGALHHISGLEHVIDQAYRCLKPGGFLMSDEYVGPAYNDLSERHREVVNAAIHLLPPHLRTFREDNFVPRAWRTPHWRRGLFELARLATLRPSTIPFDAYQPPSVWPTYKKLALSLAGSLSGFVGKRRGARRGPFQFGQVWDICPEAIRRGDPSEGVRSDEIIPVVRSRFPDTTIRYFNGSILHYALDSAFFSNYDEKRDRGLLQVLMDLERTMIAREELPPILAVIVARK